MYTHDYSDLGDSNILFAKKLLKADKILVESKNGFVLSETYKESLKDSRAGFKNVKIINFWTNFSLAVELICKGIAINQEIDIFSKLKGFENKFPHKYDWGAKIVVSKNPWLDNILKKKRITHSSMLSTGTLGSLITKCYPNFKVTCSFDTEEKLKCKTFLTKLTNHRRNRDAHFFFKTAVLQHNRDLESEYLPMINALLKYSKELS